jgi:uncharacterized protein (DUF2141 family)
MKLKGILYQLILLPLVLYILVSGCAKVNSPSGGPRDREIPVITECDPPNGTVNFTGKEISISFNEYVILDKISEKFMVSPPMKIKPKVFTRGKDVRIQFEENLRDNTTYTFYFQDAIRDLNEGNAINNYQFVLSTGPVIDSLSVTGNIYSSPGLDPPESTLMLLYSQMADSFVVKHLPDYITRAELNGEFRIDNVQPGRYRLYALKDADNSKNFNNREEEFAFFPEPVEITPAKNFLPVPRDTSKTVPDAISDKRIKPSEKTVNSTTNRQESGKEQIKPPVTGEYQMILFQSEKRDHYLTSSKRPLKYQMIYTLSLPPDSLGFSFSMPEIEGKDYFIENSKNKDTITVWLTDSTVYNRQQISTIVQFPFTDTLGITALKADTIVMRYLAPRAPRNRVVKRTPYKVNSGIKAGQLRPDLRIKFTAPVPMKNPDTSRLKLFKMVKDEKSDIPFSILRDSANSCICFMNADLQPGESYLFISDSAAFVSIYGDYSDSTGIKFALMTPESFGKLILNIKNYEGGRIIQLLDNSEKVLREQYMNEDGTIGFPLLEKGKYRLRAIFDLNGDKKWTTGEFDIHRQPEPVSYYPSEIEIKENWELKQDWDLSKKNFKDPKLLKIKEGSVKKR